MPRIAIASLLLLSCACGSDGGGAGGSGPLPALELRIVRFVNGDLVPVEDGASLPLVLAPQGGHFVFVGARVKNLQHADVEMIATARDVETGKDIGESNHAHPLMSRGADGFWDPEHETFTTLSMLQICPRGVGLDLVARPVQLTLHVKELATGRTGEAHLTFRPACDDGSCACECAADFVPGSCP